MIIDSSFIYDSWNLESRLFTPKQKPIVVILGSGASIAAIPNGDKNHKILSTMDDFLNKLGMSTIISNLNLKTKSNNLEDIYLEIESRKKE